tara:strand:- start:1504 stop:2373 length:870 start_codon:yes stop_codon:yes gene_type:complete
MKIDFTKGIQARRYATGGGRFYGPTALDVYKNVENPLKPSWTNVASVESSPGLSNWYKDKGRWADIDGPVTAIIGTIAHQCVDEMNEGKEVTVDDIELMLDTYSDIRWKLIYPNKWEAIQLVQKMLWSYQEWFNNNKPTILHSEIMMWHPEVPYAGTADLVLNIYNKRQDQDILMLADLKTGNEQDKHFEQCMAYAILLEKIYDVKVQALGVLYCQGRWRDTVKEGKMKVKVVRNKSGEFTDDANYLMHRVVKLYELWETAQKTEQPKLKPKLPKKFFLNNNKDTKQNG